MFKILQTSAFIKDFKKIPSKTQEEFFSLIGFLSIDYRDSRLHTKKLKGREEYSFRIHRDYRCIFFFESSDAITLLTIKHRKDIYK